MHDNNKNSDNSMNNEDTEEGLSAPNTSFLSVKSLNESVSLLGKRDIMDYDTLKQHAMELADMKRKLIDEIQGIIAARNLANNNPVLDPLPIQDAQNPASNFNLETNEDLLIAPSKLQIRNMIEILIKSKTLKVKEKLEAEREKVSDNPMLAETFDLIVKKYSRPVKTKAELTQLLVRRAFNFIKKVSYRAQKPALLDEKMNAEQQVEPLPKAERKIEDFIDIPREMMIG